MLIGLYTRGKFPDPYLNFGEAPQIRTMFVQPYGFVIESVQPLISRFFHLRITTNPHLYASEVARPSSCSATVRERYWTEFCSSFIA